MSRAANIIKRLIESEQFRVCAACEKEFGPVDSGGLPKSHGMCRRHWIEYYVTQLGVPVEQATEKASKYSSFCPDLGQPQPPAAPAGSLPQGS